MGQQNEVWSAASEDQVEKVVAKVARRRELFSGRQILETECCLWGVAIAGSFGRSKHR